MGTPSGKQSMDENEILARFAALEALSTSCFIFLLASAGDDPHLSKAKAILDVLNADAAHGMKHLPSGIRAEAKSILSSITNSILQNVKALRGASPTKQ